MITRRFNKYSLSVVVVTDSPCACAFAPRGEHGTGRIFTGVVGLKHRTPYCKILRGYTKEVPHWNNQWLDVMSSEISSFNVSAFIHPSKRHHYIHQCDARDPFAKADHPGIDVACAYQAAKISRGANRYRCRAGWPGGRQRSK